MDSRTLWGSLPDGALDRIVVVSPHFDDAALGAAHLLTSHPGSSVVTVLAGRPPAYPDEVTDWDAAGGFVTGDDVVAVRREEDRAAMASMGAHPVWLEFADHQYLSQEQRYSPPDVVPALRTAIDDAGPTAVFLPMGLANPDHVLTHDAGLLVQRGDGRRTGSPALVRLRGRRLQAPPRPAGLADRQALPGLAVADTCRRPGSPGHGRQAGRDRLLREPDRPARTRPPAHRAARRERAGAVLAARHAAFGMGTPILSR